ncbi:hypothetical protein [Micromonospora sp. CB01531]|uniref:hypothetical protein n=1 Tax=Micromonospora sp. CB01531 TaxID=1718947 RepID=UPI0009404A36|nr:hypothetical protein [Micromonospora sp. CB01531]OKI45092.1 hypothetical protein A6A27_11780 [Micromonospora sp. CB01531]
MQKINGYQVFAVIPRLYAGGLVDGYVIAADDHRGECVTGWVRSASDTSWSNGHYFYGPDAKANRQAALLDAIKRAGVPVEVSQLTLT